MANRASRAGDFLAFPAAEITSDDSVLGYGSLPSDGAVTSLHDLIGNTNLVRLADVRRHGEFDLISFVDRTFDLPFGRKRFDDVFDIRLVDVIRFVNGFRVRRSDLVIDLFAVRHDPLIGFWI